MNRLMQGALLLGIAALGVHQALELHRSKSWPGVEGQLTESRIHEKQRHTGKPSERTTRCCTYEVRVRYRYEVQGHTYEGDRLRVKADIFGRRELAEQQLARYPAGQPVTVYYNPDAPEQAVLIRD